MPPMPPETQAQLLDLNRRFYAAVAEPFDATRQANTPGKVKLAAQLPLAATATTTLVDVGCGNGRLAWLLEERGLPVAYVGVDANAELLELTGIAPQTTVAAMADDLPLLDADGLAAALAAADAVLSL